MGFHHKENKKKQMIHFFKCSLIFILKLAEVDIAWSIFDHFTCIIKIDHYFVMKLAKYLFIDGVKKKKTKKKIYLHL